MSEKKYEVIDQFNHVIASDMALDIAMIFMKAYCGEYYNECVTLTLREIRKNEECVK